MAVPTTTQSYDPQIPRDIPPRRHLRVRRRSLHRTSIPTPKPSHHRFEQRTGPAVPGCQADDLLRHCRGDLMLVEPPSGRDHVEPPRTDVQVVQGDGESHLQEVDAERKEFSRPRSACRGTGCVWDILWKWQPLTSRCCLQSNRKEALSCSVDKRDFSILDGDFGKWCESWIIRTSLSANS